MTLSQKIRSKLARNIKYLYRDIYYKLGLHKGFYQSARGSRILIYHGICQHDHLRFNTIFITQKTFESHLKFYKKHFNVISLDAYYKQEFSKDRFNVCLTFDDGFANNYKYVLPLLEKYKIPAAFFITAIQAAGYDILWNDFLSIVSKYGPKEIVYKNESHIKDRYNKYISLVSGEKLADKLRSGDFEEKADMMKLLSPLSDFKTNKYDEDYWLQMTPGQIRALSVSPFVTVGAHGYYHNDLAKIDINNATEELALSRQYLEDIIGEKVTSLAFPYGSYSPEVIEAAKSTGYEQLLAMEFYSENDQEDKAIRERLAVNPFISTPNQMYATITGNYE